MDSFNFCDFFNSKDITNHCKNIGHTFTALEMGYIIWRSEYHTLEQKHYAWRHLIDWHSRRSTTQAICWQCLAKQ